MPITRCGWGVTAASFMIGIDEVLLASSASGRTTLPSAWKIATFSASSSITASITRSRSASSAMSVGGAQPGLRGLPVRARGLAGFSARGQRLADPVPARSRRRPRSPRGRRRRHPARAATSAIPEPMMPPPMTPTVDTRSDARGLLTSAVISLRSSTARGRSHPERLAGLSSPHDSRTPWYRAAGSRSTASEPDHVPAGPRHGPWTRLPLDERPGVEGPWTRTGGRAWAAGHGKGTP